MTTFRRAHKKNYTVIQNSALQDSHLSFRARGILGALLSYPDDWQVSIAHLEKQSPREGRDAIKSAIGELESAGYLVRSQTRGEAGKFASVEYLVYEVPEPSTVDGFAVDGFAVDGKSATTKYYIENKIIKEQSTPPTPPKGEVSESDPIECELVESEPCQTYLTNDKNSQTLPEQKKDSGEDKSSALAIADPFLNRKSGLGYQRQKALTESLVGSPFKSIGEQDEFYSQHLNYLHATSPKLNPGQITAIAKAALKRVMGGVPDPEDRRILTLWQNGQLEKFQGLQYDPSAQRRSETHRRLQETAAKYLAQKEKENGR